jgi:2,3-bisphosphoglycerate-dependent phosphoglycerate mutase
LSERLNERYYGDLQGLNKDWARKRFGADQVHRWRRSYDERPPNGESLAMAAARVLPYFRSHVVPQLAKGQSVLISAHGNSLRAIVMHLEKIPPRQIASCEIPTGTPYVYTLDAQLHVQEKKVLQPS